jgi:hypothetical protein
MSYTQKMKFMHCKQPAFDAALGNATASSQSWPETMTVISLPSSISSGNAEKPKSRQAIPWVLISPSLPDLADLTRFSKVDFGKERRSDTSPTDIPFSITNRAASSLNSYVCRSSGIFSMDDTSVLSTCKFSKLWCPLFSAYHCFCISILSANGFKCSK